MPVYHFTLPRWHPHRVNELIHCHPKKANRLKREDVEMVGVYAYLSGVPRASSRRRVSLTIVLGPRQRGGDVDAYWKSTLDALVRNGLLVDDSKTWCELGPVEYLRGNQRGTRITLEDI